MSGIEGVPVLRVQGVDSLVFYCHTELHETDHIAYEKPVAAALVAVAEAAREFSERPYIALNSSKALARALDALTEAQASS